MKRRFLLFGIILLVFIIGIVTYTKIKSSNKESGNVKISIAEVTHSAFYAPLYVAMENGYFAEEGLDVELILTPGADKVSAAVLSNDVQIGFAGAESAIYVYTGGEKDYLQLFSGLTKRDGQFIISRQKEENFTLEDLKGKEILVGRKGGMPSLNFLNALKKAGIDEKEININYSVDFAALGGSFIGKVGDYVNLFEPNATALENEGVGYIVASIGKLSGEMPYTAFYARKSYINENEEVIESFTVAIKKGIDFTLENDARTIAKVILPQFPSLSLDDLEKIVDNYKKADSWLESPHISKDHLENLEDIMIDNDLLTSYVPYKNIVNNFYE